MRKIVLISCASKKEPFKTKAEYLYISPLFRVNLQYARSLKPDQIYILSTKYGLLDLVDVIEPYDDCINDKRTDEMKQWAEKVIRQLRSNIDLKHDEVIFLAGEKYRRYLIPHVKNYRIPLQGLCIGRQLQYLKQELKKGVHNS